MAKVTKKIENTKIDRADESSTSRAEIKKDPSTDEVGTKKSPVTCGADHWGITRTDAEEDFDIDTADLKEGPGTGGAD